MENPGKAAGKGQRTFLRNAAHRHAGVLGFHHHRDAARLEDGVDRPGDLRGEMLLGLQAVGESDRMTLLFRKRT